MMKVPVPVALLGLLLLPVLVSAQGGERPVRRELPMTNMIAKAHAAGTRDSTGRPGAKYWQLRVDYRIDTRLDPATSQVTGKQVTTIHNTSPEPLRTVTLRLDQNIFAPNASRSGNVPELTEGFRFTRAVLNGQAAQLNTSATTLTMPLGTPIAAGGTGTLELDWSFRVTRTVARGLRHGAWGDSLVQAAQWYPRVAVYDDLRGWDTEPYLGPSEFYNNFGRFDVRIDVPAGWVVGATGTLQNPEEVLTPAARERLARMLRTDEVVQVIGVDEHGPGQRTANGDRLVWHFTADSVNDFAWAASSVYAWKAIRVQIPGGALVPLNVLYTRNRAAQFEQVPSVGKHALEFYSKLWMPYAFPQHTVVDGPEQGMEYPMLIMSGLGALDHEIGHEWWPMMVANNETWYGFMDEGFNSYMNILSRADLQKRAPVLDSLGQRYGQVSGNEQEGPLMWNANFGGPMYRFQAYQKAPQMLSALGGVVGDSAVQRAMSGYAKAWAFKHPTPWDYAFFMNRALGQDLDWFWYSWLFTTDRTDASIANARTAGGRTTVTVRRDGYMPAPVVLRVDYADGTSLLKTFPADVWFAGSASYDAVLETGGKQISRITLDPFARFPDRVPADNVWPR